MATETNSDLAQQLQGASEALSRLPVLGPAIWLYARDSMRKHMFVGDIDWALLPPIVLDQCRLYTKDKLPYAFVTWALVNDMVDQRLRGGVPKIAPHEWQSGPHIWLIDVVAPFGHTDEVIEDLRHTAFAGKSIRTLRPTKEAAITARVQEWPAA